MQLEYTEVIKQIEQFLLEAPLNHIKKLSINNIDNNEDTIKRQFEKIIFSHQQHCMDYLRDSTDLELSEKALYFRLALTGVQLVKSPAKTNKLDLSCLQNLSRGWVTKNIDSNLEYGLVYASLAYCLSRKITVHQSLNNANSIKNIIHQKEQLPIEYISSSFVKIYCALCSLLNSWESTNNTVHSAYEDLPWQDRIGKHKFQAGILYHAIRNLNGLNELFLSERIGIITAFSVISKQGYEEFYICPISYLEQALEFITKAVKHELIKKEVSCININLGCSLDQQQHSVDEWLGEKSLPSVIQKKFRQYKIKKAKEYIRYKEEALNTILKKIKTYYSNIEQQYIYYLHQQCLIIKKKLHAESFKVMLTNIACQTVSYFAKSTAGNMLQQITNGIKLQDLIKPITSNMITNNITNRLQIYTNENNNSFYYLAGSTGKYLLPQAIINSAIDVTISSIMLGCSKINITHILTTKVSEAIIYHIPDNFKFIAKYGLKLIEQTFLDKNQTINAFRQLIVEDVVFNANLNLTLRLLKILQENYTNLQFIFKKDRYIKFIANNNHNMVIENKSVNSPRVIRNKFKTGLTNTAKPKAQADYLYDLSINNAPIIMSKKNDLAAKKLLIVSSYKKQIMNFFDNPLMFLRKKFVNSSWYDMPTTVNITNTCKIEASTTSTSHYKGASTEKLNVLLSKRAKHLIHGSKARIIGIDGSLKMSSKKRSKVLDFFRSKVQGCNFDVETGGRIFLGDHFSTGISLFKPKREQNVGFFIRKSVGVNLASGKLHTHLATLRTDVNSCSSGINLAFKANTSNKTTDFDMGAMVDAKLVDIKWELKSKKVCFYNHNCYKIRLFQSLGIGYGFQAGFGYVTDTEQGLSSFNLTAGSNLGISPVMFGTKIIVEREHSGKQYIVDHDVSDEDQSINRYSKMLP